MKEKYLDGLPKAILTYPKILLSLLKKNSGKNNTLSKIKYVVEPLIINPKHLHRYQMACNFSVDNQVPASYLVVLALSLQMKMMVSESFPFKILGILHIGNQITQKRVIYANEKLRLTCYYGKTKPHNKGTQFEFIINAYVEGEEVFSGVTTYLAKHKTNQEEDKKTKSVIDVSYDKTISLEIPENIGRRYAMISGDLNLFHLYPFTARLFGFKTMIAHGMWTKARVLAYFMEKLPEVYTIDVKFKLPIFIPSVVNLNYTQKSNKIDILLSDTKENKPHLTAIINFEN